MFPARWDPGGTGGLLSSPSVIFPLPFPLPQNVATRTPFSARPLLLSLPLRTTSIPIADGVPQGIASPHPSGGGAFEHGAGGSSLEAWRVVLPTPGCSSVPSVQPQACGCLPDFSP